MWSKLILIQLVIGISLPIFSQTTISGYVRDSSTKEPITITTVYWEQENLQTLTNENGFFILQLPPTVEKEITLHFASYSYETKKVSFPLTKDTIINIVLQATNERMLEEIKIKAKKSEELGLIQLPIERLKAIPMLGGEADIIKAYQFLPGIAGGQEGSSGLYVRGGSPDQNLFLIDNTPLYHVNHLGGFLSTFDAAMINSISLYKGGFPSKFSGRLSSIVDIRMKEGNPKKLKGEVAFGIISTKLQLEGPFTKKDSTWTFLLSFRRMNMDLLTRPFVAIVSEGSAAAGYTFYDGTVKIVKRFKDNSKLSLSTFTNRDLFFFSSSHKAKNSGDSFSYKFKSNVTWGNRVGMINYSKAFKNKVYSNFTLATSNFRYVTDINLRYSEDIPTELDNQMRTLFKSKVNDILFRSDFTIYLTNNLSLVTGLNSTYHIFTPGSIQTKQNDELDTTISSRLHALENNTFIELKYQFFNRLRGNVGTSISAFSLSGKTYFTVDPRMTLIVDIRKDLTFQAGYARMSQFVHSLSYAGTGLPSDLWIPATKTTRPENSDLVNAGFTYEFQRSKFPFRVSLEGFYKQLHNLVDYKEGVNLFSQNTLDSKIETGGKGTVYGLEFMLEKSLGKATGWIAYTWSKNTRQFENINGGKVYPFKYDRRHDLAIVYTQTFKHYRNPAKKISLAATWTLSSGFAITLPQAKYYQMDILSGYNYYHKPGDPYNVIEAEEYNGKNNFRMPLYHRLDLGVNFIKQKKKGVRTWNVSVYNVYNQKNPFMLFYQENKAKVVTLHQLTLFPIIPSFTYSYVF